VAANAANLGAGAADKADLWLDQGRVQALVAEVNHLPEVRQEKVAALSRVISQGNYRVTPQQTAEALLTQMQVGSAA
jgi:anti-sigma28 factor (negative regulator of flagellin synthesis)